MIKENFALSQEIDDSSKYNQIKQGKAGGEILNIGEYLKHQPKAADLLLAEYAQLVKKAEQAAEEISQLYNEVFFEKKIDKDEVASAILKQANQRLVEAEEELKYTPEDDKQAIIDDLKNELIREQMTQARMLDDFKDLINKLNYQAKEIDEAWKEADWQEEVKEAGGYDIDDDDKSEIDSEIAEYFKRKNKFDSSQTREAIESLEGFYKKTLIEKSLLLKVEDFAKLWKVSEEEANKILEEKRKAEEEKYKPYVDKLKKLLVLQEALEKKMDQIILGGFHAETDAKLKARYEEIKQTAKNISQYIFSNFNTQKKYLNAEAISDELLAEALKIISLPTSNEAERQEAEKKLEKTDADLVMLGKILMQLPRDEVGQLDLTKLPKIERLENISTSELAEKPELIEKMKIIIEKQFPAGDAEVFEQACRGKKNLNFTVTLANGEILSFYSTEKASEQIDYIDWFMANPDAPIKGLGEATARLGLKEQPENGRSYYAVIKPHVKSFNIFIEKLGFTAFGGSTLDGEYKHHYARTRRLPGDSEMKSKNFSAEKEEKFINAIKHACLAERRPQDLIFAGQVYAVAEVSYHGQTHLDDIKKQDPDGWVFKELERQDRKGRVLTRFIPASGDKNNQTYYAVFEKDGADKQLKNELQNIIPYEAKSSHSISKKALSI